MIDLAVPGIRHPSTVPLRPPLSTARPSWAVEIPEDPSSRGRTFALHLQREALATGLPRSTGWRSINAATRLTWPGSALVSCGSTSHGDSAFTAASDVPRR
jgi:hypothetical protein